MLLRGLMNGRMNFYNTNDPNLLLGVINKKYKNTFDKDKLYECLNSKKSKYNLNKIFSNQFKGDNFSELSKEFETIFSPCVIEEGVVYDTLLIDILLLIQSGKQANYQYAGNNQQNNNGTMNDFFKNFMGGM